MSRRVHLFCPTLRGLGGHEYGYTLGLKEALKRQGCEVMVVYDAGAPDLFGAEGEQLALPRRVEAAGGSLTGWLMNRFIAARRRKAFEAAFSKAGPGDVTVIHTAGFADMDLAGEVAEALSRRAGLVMRFDHYDDPAAIEVLKRLATNPWVRLLSDSLDLSQAFEALIGGKVVILPPPVERVSAGSRTSGGPPRFAYLGGARRSKGFQTLPHIAELIFEAWPDAEMMVQAYRSADDAPSEAIEQAVSSLEAMSGVQVDQTIADAVRYAVWLDEAEILLLPYDPFVYRAVSSGVFVEAIAAGKQAIIPAGTWMAHEAERFGLLRAVAADFSSDASLGAALRQAVEARGAACPACAPWAEAHSYDALASSMLHALDAKD